MFYRYKSIKNMTLLGAVKDIFLALVKVICGITGNSHALVADGVHSFFDFLVDALIIIAAKFGSKRADANHPYGHARIETVASLGLATFLIIVGLGIIVDASEQLRERIFKMPSAFVLIIALLSLVVNEVIYRYMHKMGKRIQSDLLIANAFHTRSDAAVSLVVLVGIGGSLLGFHYLDAIAAVIVGVLIIKMGVQLVWRSLSELVDMGVDEATLTEIRKILFQVPGVKAVHELRTRRMAGRVLMDVHLIVNHEITVSEGHHISERVMKALKEKIKIIDDITVHIDAENDEYYSSTSRLPLREELFPLLCQAWADVPGFNQHRSIRLHYLAGVISIEMELPLDLLINLNPEELVRQYKKEIQELIYIKDIKLLFVT